ncbi:MAG: hypothetical protein ACRC1T_09755 [Clostridium chrysemydis]|uniref:hypothetical protein n=1 Tax=Clostridium chrysemydis TaxID=2665504 RepID=UPI003F393637
MKDFDVLFLGIGFAVFIMIVVVLLYCALKTLITPEDCDSATLTMGIFFISIVYASLAFCFIKFILYIL